MRTYAVLHLLGWLLATLAATMLVPALFALALDPVELAQAFTVPAVGIGFVGVSMILAFRDRRVFSTRWESLLLLGLVWLVVPLAAAFPFYSAGHPGGGAVVAFFEAVSGFTTTGATTITDLDKTPRSIIVWRAVLQWLGGLTTLLALIAILGPLSGSFMLDRQLRIIGRGTHGSVRHIMEALRSITPAYVALTVACFLSLIWTDVPTFDAFCLSLATLSTGGFMPREGTIAIYGSSLAQINLAIFMTIGAISIVWVRDILQMRWTLVRETREPFWIFAFVCALAIIFTMQLLAGATGNGIGAFMESLSLGLATAATLVSTTGFPVSGRAHELVPFMVLLGLCVLGGGQFSTSGGMKIYRGISMLRQLGRELRILIYPHSVRPARHGEEARDTEHMKVIWIIFASFMLAIGTLATILAYTGVLFSGALLASAGALSNMGPVYEIARSANFPEAPTYAEMGKVAQLSLCFGMILGRVEILTLVTFLSLGNWRE